MAEFDESDVELLREADRCLQQGFLGLQGIGQDTSVIEKRHGDQKAAEESAGQKDQGQDPSDFVVFIRRHQIDGRVSGSVFHDAPPGRQVVAGGQRVIQNVAIPRFACIIHFDFGHGYHAINPL